jgi:hypothetical protein
VPVDQLVCIDFWGLHCGQTLKIGVIVILSVNLVRPQYQISDLDAAMMVLLGEVNTGFAQSR